MTVKESRGAAVPTSRRTGQSPLPPGSWATTLTAPLSLLFWSRTPPEPQKRPRPYPNTPGVGKLAYSPQKPLKPPRNRTVCSGLWTLSQKKAEGKGRGYERWATMHNLKQMAATLNVYQEYGFTSPEQLEAAVDTAYQEMRQTSGELKALETKLQGKKGVAATGTCLCQDQARPRRAESAEIRESPRRLPAGK